MKKTLFISFMLILTAFSPYLTVSKPTIKEINVAILRDYYVFGGSGEAFKRLLNNYTWSKEGITYEFKMDELRWWDVLNGSLSNYDVVIATYGLPIPLLLYHFLPQRNASGWMEEIREFIEKGGGFVGHCGGTMPMCFIDTNSTKIDTTAERIINSRLATLGISNVLLHYDAAIPLFDQIWGNKSMGEGSYYYCFGLGNYSCGICLNMKVNKTHPIFHGYENDTLIVRYIGGPGLIPEGDNVQELLWYPGQEEFNKYAIHEWEFSGWKNLTIEFLRQLPVLFKGGNIFEKLERMAEVLYTTPDWKMTDRTLKTHLAYMVAMTSEEYGKGRILLCGAHPELEIWNPKKGRIVENDTSHDNIWDGLVKWEGISRKDIHPGNYWLVRREVAWAAGLSERELPPIGS